MILTTNEELYIDLKKECAKFPCAPNFGLVFKRMSPFLKVYTQYITNFELATKELEKLEKQNKKFVDFLESCYQSPECENGQRILAFLIAPVQRIPRYQLLLRVRISNFESFQDLLERTPKEHVQYNDIKEGFEAIVELAKFCNERKRKEENSLVLLELVESLKRHSNGQRFKVNKPKLIERISFNRIDPLKRKEFLTLSLKNLKALIHQKTKESIDSSVMHSTTSCYLLPKIQIKIISSPNVS
jgi:hypothetical protein